LFFLEIKNYFFTKVSQVPADKTYKDNSIWKESHYNTCQLRFSSRSECSVSSHGPQNSTKCPKTGRRGGCFSNSVCSRIHSTIYIYRKRRDCRRHCL